MKSTFTPAEPRQLPPQEHLADWTLGQPGIIYQRCGACQAQWYFSRSFCPCCDAPTPELHAASGRGTVYSVTHLHRAPTEELRPYAPYTLVLIDAEEGFRMMAHGAAHLRIGDRVQASYRPFADRLLPFFDRISA